MGFIRHAAVAGQFYPGDAAELTAAINKYLAEARTLEGPAPKALIAPHAGYVYSGPIAANAYIQIKQLAPKIKRVILLGPCHRVAVNGLALSGADAFETPIGQIEIDKDAAEKALSLPQVEIFDATHELEHSLEVHLPFLQVLLDDFKLVPMVVGQASPEQVGEVLDLLWGGDETLIVISSDLSHFLDYDKARELDQQTCTAIENLAAQNISRDGACGRFPVGGILDQAVKRKLSVTTLDVRNSGDTAGQKDRVVGYGSWMFVEPKPEITSDEPSDTDEKITQEDNPEANGSPSSATKTKPKRSLSLKLTPISEPEPEPASKTVPVVNESDFEEATRQLLSAHGPDLLLLAALSIDYGLDHNSQLNIDLKDHPEAIRVEGACFVTLKKNGELRGCIGSPSAYRPLAVDVVHNANRAAFADPRFPKLEADEREDIEISISVLSPAVQMNFSDQQDFLDQLREGLDGLIIEDNGLRSLFLPSVWSQLPRKQDFVGRLKIKAGLPVDHWSPTFKAMRFIAEEISASDLKT
jgi:AmmeMemoRadiSam system protein B/AmmeMemoRadiSam system protein A